MFDSCYDVTDKENSETGKASLPFDEVFRFLSLKGRLVMNFPAVSTLLYALTVAQAFGSKTCGPTTNFTPSQSLKPNVRLHEVGQDTCLRLRLRPELVLG